VKSRSSFATLAAAVVALLIAGVAMASAPRQATLLIRHQVRGCHTWSLNGGPFEASHSVALSRGAALTVTVTVTDDDMMAHTLVKVSGPAVSIVDVKTIGMPMSQVPGAMTHMSASTRVVFAKAGVYRFTTRAGGHYMRMKTIGRDNVLRLKVTVS